METTVRLLEAPEDREWAEVRRRAIVTIKKDYAGTEMDAPGEDWRHGILAARHSPIRYLRFSFLLTKVPYWIAVHFCRHVHAQIYMGTQRNDRQHEYDRNAAPQGAPVSIIWDINAEELMIIANKRLCSRPSPETREIVAEMCRLVEEQCPEFKGLLVPMCEYQGGVCHEMKPCGRRSANA